MDEYLLPPHVHCCRRGDAFVFLDLKQDDYTLVAGAAADVLRAPANPEPSDDPLRELEQAGLLTRDRSAGRPFAATDIDLAMEPLLDGEDISTTTIRHTHWWNFAAACTTAAAQLRWRRIEDTVTRVARRKALRGVNNTLDVEKSRQLTAVFNRLRSLFPARYLCLFDSLALVEFLARYDVFPMWVFGVKLEPWGAHCWIQQGPFTFNEVVEEAAAYTPIMAV